MISLEQREFLIGYIKRTKLSTFLNIFFLVIASVVCEAFFIKSMQILILEIEELTFKKIIVRSLISLGIVLLCGTLKILQTKYYARYSAYIGKLICKDCINGYFGNDLRSSQNINSNDLINSVIVQSNYIIRGVILAFLNLTTSTLTSLGIIFILVYSLGIKILAVIFFTSFLYLIIANNNKKKLRLLSQKQVEYINDLTNQILYLINNKKKVFLNRFNIKIFQKVFKFDSDYRDFLVSTFELAVLPKYYIETFVIILLLAIIIILSMNGDVFLVSKIGILFFGILRLLPNFQNIYYSWAQINANSSQIDSFQNYKNKYSFKKKSGRVEIDKVEIFLNNKKFMQIKKGESLCLIGPSGCGKTSFLDLIGSLNKKRGFKVNYLDISNNIIDENKAKNEISFIEQDVYLDNDTVKNIIFNCSIKNKIRDKNYLVKLADLEDLLNSEFWENKKIGTTGGNLSGGQKQKVAIAEAIAWKPSILILDEATTGIDKESEEKIWNELFKIRDIIIIATTHNINLHNKFDKYINFQDKDLQGFINQ